MGVIIVNPGGGGGGPGADGHTHPNLPSLNKLKVTGPGELLVDGVAVGEKAVEVGYEVVLAPRHIADKALELPEDCDVSRALTLVLESLPQRMGDDWQVVEKTAPEKDRIVWDGLGMERMARAGDKVSINYYKKKS